MRRRQIYSPLGEEWTRPAIPAVPAAPARALSALPPPTTSLQQARPSKTFNNPWESMCCTAGRPWPSTSTEWDHEHAIQTACEDTLHQTCAECEFDVVAVSFLDIASVRRADLNRTRGKHRLPTPTRRATAPVRIPSRRRCDSSDIVPFALAFHCGQSGSLTATPEGHHYHTTDVTRATEISKLLVIC